LCAYPQSAEAEFPARAWPKLLVGTLLAVIFYSARRIYCPEYVAFLDLTAGRAETPFQYRVLVPWLARAANALLHIPLELTAQAVELAATLAIFLVAGAVLRRLRAGTIWLGLLFYMMVMNYVVSFGFSYLECYDMPALLFALVLLIAVVRQDYRVFYAVFPVAVLNRETAIFISMLFLLVAWGRLETRRLAFHMLAQLAIWFSIKAALFLIYRHNPGAGAVSLYAVPYSPIEQVHDWRQLRLVSNLGLLLTGRWLCLFGGLWLLLVLWRQRLRDPFFARALWLVPVDLAVMLWCGTLTEFRIYGELVPLIFLALVFAGEPAAATEFRTMSAWHRPPHDR
jgi:hypothetical protein